MIFGEKYYNLPITRDYVKSWGFLEGVRELIQNALDSSSPMKWFYEKGTLSIVSEHSRLEPRTLLLGCTTKADDQDAIGSFGEGYKLALLVLLREGYAPRVINNEFLWTPEFVMNNDFGMEILRIKESRYQGNLKRLVFEVNNLTEEKIEAIRNTCLHMQQTIGQVKHTSKGLILMDPKFTSKLCVGGLFICETGLVHGYDIKPEFMKLERDRQTVDNWDLRMITKDMWVETEEYELLANMMEQDTPDVDYLQFGAPEIVRDACYRHFQENHPGKVIAQSQKELDSLVDRGMTVYVTGSRSYYSGVTSSHSYRLNEGIKVNPPIVEELVTAWVEENKKHMRRRGIEATKDLIEMSKKWQVKANS